ncbi:MAG: OsmC family protein [Actinobacteria bacterium]|nr:OsmC family protein [Actinomycetota bacterium]
MVLDQPVGAGGLDAGPTPTELFVASLAACVGFYAERFLRRHDLATEGLRVDADFRMSEDRPSRVSSIEMRVRLPEGFPEARREALSRVVERCTVHNSIVRTPDVSVALEESRRVA